MTNEERKAIEILKEEWRVNAEIFGVRFAEAMNLVIEALEQREWIPVSERMPDDETEVLFQYQYGQSMMVGYHKFDYTIYPFGHEDSNETGWYDRIDDFICGDDEVIAWQPLPEAYKEV